MYRQAEESCVLICHVHRYDALMDALLSFFTVFAQKIASYLYIHIYSEDESGSSAATY
jgi:hypothetical protein